MLGDEGEVDEPSLSREEEDLDRERGEEGGEEPPEPEPEPESKEEEAVEGRGWLVDMVRDDFERRRVERPLPRGEVFLGLLR